MERHSILRSQHIYCTKYCTSAIAFDTFRVGAKIGKLHFNIQSAKRDENKVIPIDIFCEYHLRFVTFGCFDEYYARVNLCGKIECVAVRFAQFQFLLEFVPIVSNELACKHPELRSSRTLSKSRVKKNCNNKRKEITQTGNPLPSEYLCRETRSPSVM